MPVLYKSEKEALSDWCPFARVVYSQAHHSIGSSSAGYNRGYGRLKDSSFRDDVLLPNGATCIASKCARWDAEKKFDKLTGNGRCGA